MISVREGEGDAVLFASLWQRNRLIVSSPSLEAAARLVLEMKCFMPEYRQLLLCGRIPKEARYLKNAKLLETQDAAALRTALSESLAEEEMGTLPVQIVYFGADEAVFRDVLRHLDRGWAATTRLDHSALEKESLRPVQKMSSGETIVYFLDAPPEDLSMEERIIDSAKASSQGVRRFKIQMQESQVHIAFEAILAEIESGRKITQSYLSDTLNLREQSLRKVIEIGRRERRVDIAPYIEDTAPAVVNFLKKVSSENEVSLAAVFERKKVIGFARYHEVEFPLSYFLQLLDVVENLPAPADDQGLDWSWELIGERRNVLILKNHHVFCFLLEKGIQMPVVKLKLKKLIETEAF